MKMEINLGHVSGSRSKGGLNVFAQLAEPKTKDGIWIKTEHITTDEPLCLADIPYNFYQGSAVAVGTDVYLLGGGYSTIGLNNNYKYDTLTNTYTKMNNIPYKFWDGLALAVGTDIHLFSCRANRNAHYKYDTLTDTYTKLTDIPLNFTGGAIAQVGTDIYLIGGDLTDQICKYDILTDTYTIMEDMPYTFKNGTAVGIGTDIYISGVDNSSSKNKTFFKYDTLNGQYTKINLDLTSGKVYFGSEIVSIGTDIYAFGSGYLYNKEVYKYNTLTNEFIKLDDMPYSITYYSSVISINTKIYIFGDSTTSSTKAYIYGTYIEYTEIGKYDYNKLVITSNMPTTLEDGNIYALYGNTYTTKLLEQMTIDFASVFLYKDGETQIYPIYLGNGQEWVKILN